MSDLPAQRAALLAALAEAERGSIWLDTNIRKSSGLPVWKATRSVDDAIMLVPPGHSWVLYSDGAAACMPTNPEAETWRIVLQLWHAATPALALCIAALRARWAAEEGL